MNKLDKKLRKLMRDPKLFFTDMYKKRKNQIKKYYPIKTQGIHQYTVVSAVYNVEKYLDEFFSSLTKQSLNFKNHIQLILVDDGSTDSSAKIIKKWQKKFPHNIQYIYKENGGQASARNLGLEYVQTEWVVFTDPDDYLHTDYFKSIDSQLQKRPDLAMIATNMLFFMENQNIVKDTHPLKFRFNDDAYVKISNLDKLINLSVATTFFKMSEIRKNKIYFDNRVKPNFEDGKFIADYLFNLQNGYANFCKSAIYFYRKREDNSSTLDGSWKKPEKYSDVFEFGFLPMLKNYKDKFKYIPNFIQKTALYDLGWYIQYLLNSPEKINFLDEDAKQKFYHFIDEAFSFIDEKNIMEFGLGGIWMFHKVGMLGAFKNAEPPFQMAYIENIDREQKQILVSYFTYFDFPFSIESKTGEIFPEYSKTVKNTFNDKLFVYEKRLWVPYGNIPLSEKLKISLNSKKMRISILGKVFNNGISPKEIEDLFTYSEKYLSDGSWLLMDRETKADDNAEHLYRYIMKNHPSQVCYFALNKSSSDWNRLAQEGFKLVEFGTNDFKNKLCKASKIISSHLEAHINNHFGDLYEFSKKFIFLQHGVTKDDLSRWVNTKKNLHCFVTTTQPEYNSIVQNLNKYKLTEKEVVLTGFPRYDSLFSKKVDNSNQILIMPTWRNNIVGTSTAAGANTRTINKNFMETEYAKHWYSLLHSSELKKMIDEYNYEVIFAPHPNIQPYLNQFKVPKYIKCWSGESGDKSIQDLFGESSILITDYSSVAFDMAYLNKAIVYYQFDKESFFSGNHTYQQGYFSYEKDGFGPVLSNEKELLSALSLIIKNNGKPNKLYEKRIKETFPFQDQGNCERVYQAIINLDRDSNRNKLPIIESIIEQAEKYQNWRLIETRTKLMLDSNYFSTKKEKEKYENKHFNALFMNNNFFELLDTLNKSSITPNQLEYWKAKIDLQLGKPENYVSYFAKNNTLSVYENLLALIYSAYIKQEDAYKQILEKVKKSKSLTESTEKIILLAKEIYLDNLEFGLDIIESLLEKMSKNDKILFKLELIASYLCMDIFKLKESHQYLVEYEKNAISDPACRIAIARLAKINNNKAKLVDQLDKAFGEEHIILMPSDLYIDYLQGIENNHKKVNYLLDQWITMQKNNIALINFKVKILLNENKWQDIISLLEKDDILKEESLAYAYVFSLFKLGKLDKANSLFGKIDKKESYFYWKLAAEHAEKNNNIELLKICLEKQYNCAIYLTQ